jgi:hypothetical protein
MAFPAVRAAGHKTGELTGPVVGQAQRGKHAKAKEGYRVAVGDAVVP